MQIAIAGAGVAGLASAILLARQGKDVMVFLSYRRSDISQVEWTGFIAHAGGSEQLFRVSRSCMRLGRKS